jgi:hypothetical protein
VGIDGSPKRHQNDTSATQGIPGVRRSVNFACAITQDIGTRECAQFRNDIFHNFPAIASDLALRYRAITEQYDYVAANRRLLTAATQLQRKDLNLSENDQSLRDFAGAKAEECRIICNEYPRPSAAISRCIQVFERYGFPSASITSQQNIDAALARLRDPRWWIRQIRKQQKQAIDSILKDLGLINKFNGKYTSDFTLHLHQRQNERNQLYLARTMLTNETGEQICLADVAEHTVSNPAIRRHELMARIRGFETVAKLYDHAGEFYTLTTPSRFHQTLAHGKPNPKYQTCTPKDGQAWLTHTWALIRAKLDRLQIRPYGIRVAEPHHDGTPHWHFLLFVNPTHRKKLRQIFRRYALQENEAGAHKHRFKAVAIDHRKGSAAGYIAKYVAKNLDGTHLNETNFDSDAITTAQRTRCWASTWGIRQFQQIGGPSVTVWRELRRLSCEEAGVVSAAQQAADSGNWAAYVLAMGGVDLPRQARPVQPHREYGESIDRRTGEITLDDRTQYGEKRLAPIRGLRCGTEIVMTRKHRWTREAHLELAHHAGLWICGAAADQTAREGPATEAHSADLGLV